MIEVKYVLESENDSTELSFTMQFLAIGYLNPTENLHFNNNNNINHRRRQWEKRNFNKKCRNLSIAWICTLWYTYSNANNKNGQRNF